MPSNHTQSMLLLVALSVLCIKQECVQQDAETGNHVPVVAATATPLGGAPPLIVTFDASGCWDADGDALAYTWDFGDGQTGTGVGPSHSYVVAGTFIVTLRVSDGRGGDASTTLTIAVTSPSEPAPATCIPAASSAEPPSGPYRAWNYQWEALPGFVAMVGGGRVAISEAGERVALIGGWNAYLFGRDSNQPLWTYNTTYPDGDPMTVVAISRSGASLVIGSGSKIRFFECDSGTPAWVYSVNPDDECFSDVAISHDGCYVVATEQLRNRLYVFRRDSGVPIQVFDVAVQRGVQLKNVEISGDGTRIVAGTIVGHASGAEMYVFDRNQLLWTHATDNQEQRFEVDMPIAVSNDGSRIACVGADRRLHFFAGGSTPLWSADCPVAFASIAWDEPYSFYHLNMSDDGSHLLAAGPTECWYYGDTASSSPTWVFDGQYRPADPALFSVRPCDETNALPCQYVIADGVLPTTAMSADGEYLAVDISSFSDPTGIFCLYRGIEKPFRMYAMEWGAASVALSADGAWLAASTLGGQLQLWEIAPAELIEIGTPLAMTIAGAPGADEILDIGDVQFTRHLIKPGRAATLLERWTVRPLIVGLGLIPGLDWLLGGTNEEQHTLDLPAGNYYVASAESMDVPQVFASFISGVTLFELRAELLSESQDVQFSDDSEIFAEVQLSISGP